MSDKNIFDAKVFIDKQTHEIRQILGKNRAIIACSGGVDSTTCAVLTRKAVGENLVCVFIDTNFMRLGEPENVIKTLSAPPMNLPIKLIDARMKFMEALKQLTDAEEKRKAFRNTFYSVLCEVAKNENCHFLVQGTILPDIIETTKGIKTQHNVLEQIKIDTSDIYGFKLVEPLVSLYKFQVREVARCLGLPSESSERQPFPGPGLSVRVVGEVTSDKLEVEKKATMIVEQELEKLKPKQYFSAIIDSAWETNYESERVKNAVSTLLGIENNVNIGILKTRATGIKAGKRLYGRILTVDARDKSDRCVGPSAHTIDNIQKRIFDIDRTVSRVLYRVTDLNRKGQWLIAVRSVETLDFVTASVSNIPWNVLRNIGEILLSSCKNVSAVYYDITPKPPGSIEFE